MAVRTAKVIFYQIPKTGGTWVRVAMRNAGLRLNYCQGSDKHEFDLRRDHATPNVIHQRYKPSHFSFCFVRHPVNWYQSFWSYRMKTRRFWNRRFPPDRYWSDDFDKFVSNVLSAFPDGFVTALYQYYVDDVDYVGRQETLADNLVEALHLGGETFDEVSLRATPPQNVVASDPKYGSQCHVSSTLREEIVKVERQVLERFYA